MIPPRKPIVGGEWRVSIQLEIDGEPVGEPLQLRYSDSFVAGGKSASKDKRTSSGSPEDFGYLISLAHCTNAQRP